MGDDDLVVAGVVEIDMVVADAEAGDDLELRKLRDHRLIDAHEVGHGDAADALAHRSGDTAEIALVLELMQDKAFGQAFGDDRLGRAEQQNVGFLR